MPQPSAAPTQISPADSFNALLSVMESEVVSAAEAMPADKYDFAPSSSIGLYTGVRSFSAQVKHLIESNYAYFRGFGVPGAVDSKTIEALKTKEDLVKALKDSYAFAHAAISTLTPDNAFLSVAGPPAWKLTRASVAAFAIAHSMDHYGQMVEYLRMNGLVPPASRPR
ncbi:MAG TPA: DinB family protein [Acidobacteriaceae bacterium]|nr:DinB family protein [Acidobacteriaceae bacterium]